MWYGCRFFRCVGLIGSRCLCWWKKFSCELSRGMVVWNSLCCLGDR